MEAGLRNRVEIWADGGYRHGHDIVKLLCLGANRVGFGTLAMVSLGCTICRGCQLDTCHVGIATQIESEEEAQLKGLKKFTPQVVRGGGRELRALLRGDGRGGRAGRCLARVRARPGPGRPLGPARAVARARERVDVDELIRPLEQMLDLDAAGRRPTSARPRASSRRARWRWPPPTASACSGPRGGGRAGAGAHPRRRLAGRARAPSASRRRSPARASRRSASRASTSRSRAVPRTASAKAMYGGKVAVMKGAQPARPAPQRLGRQVVRLRRPARAAVRAGRRRLALLHPPLRRRRGGRRRAGRPARRLARLPRRPRQPEGVRVRVHDRRPRGRARRSRAVVLRRPDRRAGVPAREPRLEPRPRGARAPPRQGREGRRWPSSTPRACATCASCSAPTRASCARPGQEERGRARARAGGGRRPGTS